MNFEGGLPTYIIIYYIETNFEKALDIVLHL